MLGISRVSKTMFPILILAVAINFKVSQCYNYGRNASSVATVEILSLVDHTLAEILGTDQQIYEYLSASWNAANRYYRQFKDPEVHLKLVAVKIFRSEAEESFFVFKKGHHNDYYVHWLTLLTMSGWIEKNKDTLPKNDLVYLHFGYRNFEGRAYIRGKNFCTPTTYNKPVASSDLFGESGVAPKVMAHEVGHSLGCSHCSSSGYVMCFGPKMSGFHEDSEKVIYESMKHVLGSCVSTFDATEEQMSQYNFNRTVLPGDIITLDHQCERYNQVKGAKAIVAESDCENLFCLLPSGAKVGSNIPPIGTTDLCPKGQRCLEGICKSE